MSTANEIHFFLNGKPVVARECSPTQTLLYFLRNDLVLTGTKEGCNEGDCGACTVVTVDPEDGQFKAINACLILLPSVEGRHFWTVEGLRKENGQYHAVQKSMVEKLGSQCGYCTPGIVMSLFEAHYRNDLDEEWKLDDQMCGNLCRCTGYRPIRDAALETAGKCPKDAFTAYRDESETTSASFSVTDGEQSFTRPATLEELWDILDAKPNSVFLAGGTDLVLSVTKRFEKLGDIVSLDGLKELKDLSLEGDTYFIGAGVSLSRLESECKTVLPSVERMLRFFGARQIKNRGTVGGNLCNASPIGDMPPVLLSLDATAVIAGRAGTRRVALDDFFVGYRKTALEAGEILLGVEVPAVKGDVRAISYKVSKRQELDISAVAAGCLVELEDGTVKRARFAFGGMAATPIRARAAESAILGKKWNEDTAALAAEKVAEELTPISDHRGSAWYRAKVAGNLILGFYEETSADEAMPRLSYRPSGTVVVEG